MNGPVVSVGGRPVGRGHPCFIIGEIGINHNGSVELAKRLVDSAVVAGCDIVKFQKRTPKNCIPVEQQGVLRETPWGAMTYLEYRHRIELDRSGYEEIARHCDRQGIAWFASCWDEESIDFIETFDPPCHKVPSAAVTDLQLLKYFRATKRPVILSTGMSTVEQICRAVDTLGTDKLLIAHCTSTYPCTPEELNLRVIETIAKQFPCPVGYSGHEVGLQTTCAAVALGACFIERHITLDRAMWGTDQAASVESQGLKRLVRDVRVIEAALGDGVKRVYESEKPVMAKLRRVL